MTKKPVGSTSTPSSNIQDKIVSILKILICAIAAGMVGLDILFEGSLRSEWAKIPHLQPHFLFGLAAVSSIAGAVMAAHRRFFTAFLVTLGGGLVGIAWFEYWLPKFFAESGSTNIDDLRQASVMLGLWFGLVLSFAAVCVSTVLSWVFDKFISLSDSYQPALAGGFVVLVIAVLFNGSIMAAGDLLLVQPLLQPKDNPHYNLEPSRWTGSIRYKGKESPFTLVIEEVKGDHSFVGYMEWSGQNPTTLAVEGTATGNHLEFVDTVFLVGDEDNGTGDRKNVWIKGNRMIGTDKGGTASFRAEGGPWTPDDQNPLGGVAMKAAYVKWRQDVDVCRNWIGSPVEDCWRTLARQTGSHFFCNEIQQGLVRRACKNSVPTHVVSSQSSSPGTIKTTVVSSSRPQSKPVQQEPTIDLESLLGEVEGLQAQFAQGPPQARSSLLPKISEKMGLLMQAEQRLRASNPDKIEQLRQTIGERASKAAETYKQMYEGMSQEDLRQTLVGMLKAHEQKRDQLCEQGDPEACLAVANDRFSKDKWEEAKPLYTLVCTKGNDQGCLGQAKVEAIDGDPAVARALIKKICESGRTLGECFAMNFSASAYVHALPQSLNHVHASLPEGAGERVKVHLPYLQAPDPARRSFGEGLKRFLGIEGPVDFAQAERAFLQAQLQGLDVSQALIQAAADLRHAGTANGSYHLQTEVWAKVKLSLLYRKACALGEQRACTDFEGDSQWSEAGRYFGMGQYEQAKGSLKELCGKGRSIACLALGAAEAAVGHPTRASEIHDKNCRGTKANGNDKLKEGCRHLAIRIEATTSGVNFEQAPIPERFKSCYVKLQEQLLQKGDADSRAIAAGLAEFFGVDRPINKNEAERLFLTANQQWLKSSLVLTSAARSLSACPGQESNLSLTDLFVNEWKQVSLFMTACRLGDGEACREDGFRRYFYSFARDEEFMPVRSR